MVGRSTPRLLLCTGAFILALTLLTGCQTKRVSITDAFPTSGIATPWMLYGEVWSGDMDEALEAVGEDGEGWAAYQPERVWLAVYRHDTRPSQSLIVRAWAFPSDQQARKAYEFFRPTTPNTLKAGDEGCWTSDGILVLWGRMVFDIFGRGGGSSSPEQAVYMLAFFEKRMPPGLPYNPE